MDGSSMLYYRVDRPAIRQFARLAINSNEQHPTHHRDATRTPHSALHSPVTPSQLHSTLLSVLSATSLSTDRSNTLHVTNFPSPLVDIIVQYALSLSLLVAEVDGGMHEHCSLDASQVGHWRALHTDALTSLTSLPDGQHCATSSHDGRIIVSCHLAAAPAGEELVSQWSEVRRIEHKYAVHTLQGALAVDTLQTFDSNHGALSEPHQPPLTSALVVGSSVGVFVYCPSTGRMLHELSGHTNRVSALCVLPGPSYSASVVVSASWDGSCRVWSLQSAQCECVLRGRGKPLTCVTAVDRGCVAAGDVAGGVSVWQFAAAMRAATSHTPLPHKAAFDESPAPLSSSIASIRIAGHTSAAYVFRSPDAVTAPALPVPAVQPSSHFSASSAATRAVLSVQASGLLWIGSDDGLRLFAPADSGEWLCLRRIATPSPRGSSFMPVHSLLWLSSCRMAVGMSSRIELWNCQSLLEAADVDSAAQVECEWTRVSDGRSVRCLAARHWLDITQPMRPPAADEAASGSHHEFAVSW